MTTEELIASGLPVEPIVEGLENSPPVEDGGSPAASGSRSHEDGEVRSDEGGSSTNISSRLVIELYSLHYNFT
jgi:hypothetical protein